MDKDFKDTKVGDIVVENFDYAPILQKYGIDFCCGGSKLLSEACSKAGVDVDEVIKALDEVEPKTAGEVDFKSWPTDLLIDYVLKYHHRRVREKAPEIEALISKVANEHMANHPELREVRDVFHQAALSLYEHLPKEENVLFPYVYELMEAKAEGRTPRGFHCGPINNPIQVMEYEHDLEGQRFRKITILTSNYKVPEDACDSYRLMLMMMKEFEKDLHQHIHLENNIIFPRAIALQEELTK